MGRSSPGAYNARMQRAAVCLFFLLATGVTSADLPLPSVPERGVACWYGETHRGKTMANGQKFDPDRYTAASWTYPLGSRVRVTLENADQPARTLTVTITDRGPARKWVEQGRIIDLSKAAFAQLAPVEKGLIPVSVQPLP